MASVHAKSDFNVEEACKKLQKAMKGMGTNEAAIIEVLTTHDAKQRALIRERYSSVCGKDLMKELKSELSGDFEKAVLALMTPLPLFLAQEIKGAIKGAGTKEKVLVDILLPRTNRELVAIREAYNHEFSRELVEDLAGDLGGDLQLLFVTQVAAQRDEGDAVDREEAERDASVLFQAGEGRAGTDESAFTMVLVKRNFAQLRVIFEIYEKRSGKEVEEAIRKETRGVLKDALITLVKFAKSHAKYFAERIEQAVKGVGTDERTLIRIIISRAEIDLKHIADEYAASYGKPLAKVVHSELSGDFRKLLVKLIGEH